MVYIAVPHSIDVIFFTLCIAEYRVHIPACTYTIYTITYTT